MYKKIFIVIFFIIIFILSIHTETDKFNKKIGINQKTSFSYYRRGYAFIIDVLNPINPIAGLYIEPGVYILGFKNSNSHFFAITNSIYNIKNQGISFGIKTNLRYRFQLVKNFGLFIGNGISLGPEFETSYSYVDLVDYTFINFVLTPDIFLGFFINFKNYNFDISCTKLFPITLLYYIPSEQYWHFVGGSYRAKLYNPNRFICVSAVSIDFGFTFYYR